MICIVVEAEHFHKCIIRSFTLKPFSCFSAFLLLIVLSCGAEFLSGADNKYDPVRVIFSILILAAYDDVLDQSLEGCNIESGEHFTIIDFPL